MLVQTMAGFETRWAKITLPGRAIEGLIGGRIIRVVFWMPFELLEGNAPIRITFTDLSENDFPVHVRCVWASSSFKMMCEATGGRVPGFAKGALDTFAYMDPRSEVLRPWEIDIRSLHLTDCTGK